MNKHAVSDVADSQQSPWRRRSAVILRHAVLGLLAGVAAYSCTSTKPSTTDISAISRPEPLPPFLPPATSQPVLCRRYYLTPEQGKEALQFSLDHFATSRAEWQIHAAHLRLAIQKGANLYPFPRRTPLHPMFMDRRTYDGYWVENVAFESIPGYWACCNLYHPLNTRPGEKLPAILNTHGHGDQVNGGRFAENVQHRCATLARMGAVAMSIEMFGYGDSLEQVPKSAHSKSNLGMTVQAWDNMRAVDFLQSLPDVDPTRIGVTGESGGGTQTFVLTALDPRVTLNVPVVMVSSYFFGGCMCESGLPIHRDAGHFCTNAEIASLFAPKPLLVVSDGADWTQHVPEIEFPFLKKIYALNGAPDNVENAHFPKEHHDYGPNKRLAMYKFVARHWGLNIHAATHADGTLDESHVTLEKPEQMRVWTQDHPLPANALHRVEAIREEIQKLQAGVASAR